MHTIDQHPSRINAYMELRGTLVRNAEVRNKVLDGDGHTVPVLCIEFTTDSSSHMPVRAEQVYKPNEHKLAETHAKALRRGGAVTITAPLVGLKLVATNASAITPEAAEPTETPDQLRQGALL
ncbi:hypothetical protein [Limnohabitans sp.]|uniref:hypothetical protein n=1 Tax=Limnohabitans sp. TaxID=1907725 RepID=UPI00286F5F63|nr:hypothetical protein [Limnohabitans sp.]